MPVYENEMRYVAKMQNVSGHLNSRCAAAYPTAESWRCFMAEYVVSR